MENNDREIVFSADFANLPDVPLLKIFRYLRTDELCLAKRVCSRWLELSRSPSLWKSVDLHHIQLSSVRIENLFRILPSNTKYLRIYRFPLHDELNSFFSVSELGLDLPNMAFYDFRHIITSNEVVPQFSFLQNQCPDLQTLIMDSVVLNHSTSIHRNAYSSKREVWNYPVNIKVLSVRRCQILPQFFFYDEPGYEKIALKIEVLDFSKCIYFTDYSLRSSQPHRLQFLQELYLAGCPITDYGLIHIAAAIPDLKVLDIEKTKVSCFSLRKLNQSCQLLEQLFIGGSLIKDEELRRVYLGYLRNLKVICLKGTRTSWESRRSLISSLPTLLSMNGFPCNQVLSEELPEDYCEMCDHFLLREKYFEV